MRVQTNEGEVMTDKKKSDTKKSDTKPAAILSQEALQKPPFKARVAGSIQASSVTAEVISRLGESGADT